MCAGKGGERDSCLVMLEEGEDGSLATVFLQVTSGCHGGERVAVLESVTF